jgi:coproporphyrinogen III oxidase
LDPGALVLEMRSLAEAVQEEICAALERSDGRARFGRDPWIRQGGGGGVARVLAEGDLLERAGSRGRGSTSRPWGSRWCSTPGAPWCRPRT